MITAEYFIDVFKYHNKPEYTRQEIEFAIKSASEYIDLIVTQGKLKHDETLEFDDKGLLSGGNDKEKVEQIKTAICRTTLFCLDNGFDFLSGSSMASAGDFSITDNIDFAVSIKNLDNYLYAIFSKYYDLNILKHQDLTNVQEPKDNDRTMFVSGADRELISAKEMRKQINEWGANNITAISPIKIEKQIPEDNSSLLRLTLVGSDIKGPPGEPGKPGRDGKDGINAFKKIKVNNDSLIPKQPIILEIDAPNSHLNGDNHTIKLKLRDGRDGQDGKPGKDGDPGKDGVVDYSLVYKKDEVDQKLDKKSNKDEVYQKQEIDRKLNTKSDKSDVYVKKEVDDKLSNVKVDTSSLQDKIFKKSPGGGEGSKVDKLPLGVNRSRISEVADPEVDDDAATKNYVDAVKNSNFSQDGVGQNHNDANFEGKRLKDVGHDLVTLEDSEVLTLGSFRRHVVGRETPEMFNYSGNIDVNFGGYNLKKSVDKITIFFGFFKTSPHKDLKKHKLTVFDYGDIIYEIQDKQDPPPKLRLFPFFRYGGKFENIYQPSNDRETANKKYVDDKIKAMFLQLGYEKEQVEQAHMQSEILYQEEMKQTIGKERYEKMMSEIKDGNDN